MVIGSLPIHIVIAIFFAEIRALMRPPAGTVVAGAAGVLGAARVVKESLTCTEPDSR